MNLDQRLRDWAEQERSAPPPSAEATAALVNAARRRRFMRRAALATPVLAMAAAALLTLTLPDPETASPLPPAPVASKVSPPALEWLPEGPQNIGADLIDVAPGALARVEAEGGHTRVLLEAGTVDLQVAPRDPGADFTVAAGDHAVRVVGTRFSVTREPFAVAVTEGIVEVIGAQTWRLEAGDRFESGARIRPEPPAPAPEPPAVEALRARLLAGELDAAREGLAWRLRLHPREVESWTLLAQLERKAGAPAAAVAAWRQVIRHGQPAEAQRARFEAASLSEGQPAEAEALLRAFLEQPDPLAAEARLRLARALIAQNRTSEALNELDALIAAHPGSAPARSARALREEIPENPTGGER
ncbi:MAG: tetratricopeptide repeat protein [Alphaproteobacteria bacterium]|nr:tetratricopeptide repeat protein [Alphaproteobacteria bacterium]